MSDMKKHNRERCKTCSIHKKEILENYSPICTWYLNNVLIGDKEVDDCPDYRKKRL